MGECIPSHCLSVLAVRLIAVKGAPVDGYRALLCRHRCQSSINTVTRDRAQGLIGGPRQRADGWCVEFLVTILRGHQTCPAAGANPTMRDKIRNTLMIEPRKATKGRRMSKKTRKKSSKAPPGNPARRPPQSHRRRRPPAAQRPRSRSRQPRSRREGRQDGGQGAARNQPKRPKPLRPKHRTRPPSKSLKSNPSAPPEGALQSPPPQPLKASRPPVPPDGSS